MHYLSALESRKAQENTLIINHGGSIKMSICTQLTPVNTTPPQPNHNVTPTHIEPGMYKLIYTVSEYIQKTLSKNILHTKNTQ